MYWLQNILSMKSSYPFSLCGAKCRPMLLARLGLEGHRYRLGKSLHHHTGFSSNCRIQQKLTSAVSHAAPESGYNSKKTVETTSSDEMEPYSRNVLKVTAMKEKLRAWLQRLRARFLASRVAALFCLLLVSQLAMVLMYLPVLIFQC